MRADRQLDGFIGAHPLIPVRLGRLLPHFVEEAFWAILYIPSLSPPNRLALCGHYTRAKSARRRIQFRFCAFHLKTTLRNMFWLVIVPFWPLFFGSAFGSFCGKSGVPYSLEVCFERIIDKLQLFKNFCTFPICSKNN